MNLENMPSQRSQNNGHILYDPVYLKSPDEANGETQEIDYSCQAMRAGEVGLTAQVHGVLFEDDGSALGL